MRWFGAHKTVLGVAAGVGAALATSYLQHLTAWNGGLLPHSRWLTIGALCGVGAMAGDVLKSWAKRRKGIAPGARWVPADQLDFVLGALALVGPWAHLTWLDVALVLFVSFAGDVGVNQMAYRLRIREAAW